MNASTMRPSILVVGEGFEDLVFLDVPQWPAPGHETKTDRMVRVPGGGALNTALVAADLGLSVTLMTAVGEATHQHLGARGIQVVNMLEPGDAPAITVVLSTPQDRSFLTYNGVNRQLEDRLYQRLFEQRLKSHDGHLHFAFEPCQLARWVEVCTQVRARGWTVSWDVGWSEALAHDPDWARLTHQLNVLFLNDVEATLYAGADQLESAIQFWMKHDSHVVIKQGAHGALCLHNNHCHHAAARAANVVDTTGAGDAFAAGFLHAWLQGKDAMTCLVAGNARGAAAVEQVGVL